MLVFNSLGVFMWDIMLRLYCSFFFIAQPTCQYLARLVGRLYDLLTFWNDRAAVNAGLR